MKEESKKRRHGKVGKSKEETKQIKMVEKGKSKEWYENVNGSRESVKKRKGMSKQT